MPDLDYQPRDVNPKLIRFLSRPRNWLLILLAIACIIATVAIVNFTLWYSAFNHRLDLAKKHAAQLQARVANDPRFAEVHFEEFTAQNGCLLVSGYVTADADRLALKNIVNTSNCPVPVLWHPELFNKPTTHPQTNRTP